MRCKRCGRDYDSDKTLRYVFTLTGDLMDSQSGIGVRVTTQLCDTCRKFLENDFRGKLVDLMAEYGLDDQGEFISVTKLADELWMDDTNTRPKFKVIEGGKE